jgi:peptide/nickel transport system permease protein
MLCAAVILLCAPFFAPYSEDEQNRSRAQENPTHIHIRGARPVIIEGGQTYPIRFFTNGHFFGISTPARIFLFGSDEYGRDVFSRFLFGGRVSVAGGIVATLLALTLGLSIGAAAGLGFRWLDELLMRTTELFLSLPWLYLLLALRAILPLQLSTTAAFWLVTAVIALSGWPRPARLIRGMVLSAKERPYVQVARSLGASPSYLFRHHILPQLRGLLWAQALLILPQFVLADMALSFLGLGAGEPSASWGGMLAALRHFSVLESHIGHWAPALLMVCFFLGMQLLNRRQPSPTSVKISGTIQ